MNRLDDLFAKTSRGVTYAWIGSLTAFSLASVLGTRSLYANAEARHQAALGIDASRALVALYGSVPLDGSLGSLAVVKLLSLGSLGAALGGSLVATRLSRELEESGGLTLLALGRRSWRALARRAGLVALLRGALLAMLVAGTGINGGLSEGGSLLLGSALGLAWILGASLSLALAQVVTHARSVRLATAALLLGLYLLRALGDSTPGLAALSAVSPFHWILTTTPFEHPRVLGDVGVLILVVLVLLAGEFARRHRDLGGPHWTVQGRARSYAGTLGVLWWRRHRVLILSSTVATLGLSSILSAASGHVSRLVSSSSAATYLSELAGRGNVKDQVISLSLLSACEIALALGLALLVSRRHDETSGALRLVDAQPPPASTHWWRETILVYAAVLTCSTAGLGVFVAGVRRDVLVAGAGRLVGTGVALSVGLLLSRRTPPGVIWAPLVVTVLAGEVAPLVGLLRPLARLSPYWWLGSGLTTPPLGATVMEMGVGLLCVVLARRSFSPTGRHDNGVSLRLRHHESQ